MSEENAVSGEQLPVSSEEESEDLKQVNTQQAEEIEKLKAEVEALKPPSSPHASQKTQGVKPSRSSAASILQSAAKKATRSNSRSDVHEYMRIRRGYV